MHQVLYYSRGGNTRKVADVIAAELGTKARAVDVASIEPAAGVIFLGSGVYGGKPGEDLTKFIEACDFAGRKVAVFTTSYSNSRAGVDTLAAALKKKGATVLGDYHCKGQFLRLMARGHPDAADLDAARKFARETVKNG
jgi:flavodoxin